jgi:hypothetical protein
MVFFLLTWICLMVGVHCVKRNVISRTVFGLRDVISRTVFGLRDVTPSVPRSCIGCKNIAESFLCQKRKYCKNKRRQNTLNNTD